MKLTDRSFHKILIIQTAFIGDVILVTPLIRAVRQALPDSELQIMLVPPAFNLVENNPHVSRIIVYDKHKRDVRLGGFLRIIKEVNSEGFDLVVSPHRSLRSALIAYASGARVRIGFATSAGAFLYNVRVPYQRNIHEIDRNISLLQAIGLPARTGAPEIFPDNSDQKVVDALFKKYRVYGNKKLVALAPGSVWPTKRWPRDHYVELAKRLSSNRVPVLLVGGQQDRQLCEEIAQQGEYGISVAGQLTLRQSAELLHRCRVLVSNDSAPVHLASAVGTPVVAIFGPTVPGFGFYPYGPNSQVIEVRLPCRPCGLHGSKKCPLKTHQCMKDILPEKVFQSVESYLK